MRLTRRYFSNATVAKKHVARITKGKRSVLQRHLSIVGYLKVLMLWKDYSFERILAAD